MADKHTLNYDVRELKLGSSFTNNKSSQYHTIKCKYKLKNLLADFYLTVNATIMGFIPTLGNESFSFALVKTKGRYLVLSLNTKLRERVGKRVS